MRRRGGRWAAVILSAIVIGGLCLVRLAMVGRAAIPGRHGADRRRHAGTAGTPRPLATCRPSWTGAPIRTGPPTCWASARRRADGRGRRTRPGPRIPPDSPFSGRAVAGRMDLLIEQGRLADAEHLIERAADARGSEGSALRMLLIPIFVQEGRAEEAERLIESRWRNLDAKGEGASEQAINLARLHMELRWNVPPADAVRAYLDQVGRLAPDDDRIWLGRANLAIRAGSYDEAARWIDACLRRRPDDRAVWRARLDWAMRTNRLADVADRPEAPAGRVGDSRGGPPPVGLAGGGVRRCRSRAARAGRPRRGGPRGLRGAGAPREAGAARRRRPPPSRGGGGRRSNATRRGIASSIAAISRRAMPRRWPAWPNGWAIASRRSSS